MQLTKISSSLTSAAPALSRQNNSPRFGEQCTNYVKNDDPSKPFQIASDNLTLKFDPAQLTQVTETFAKVFSDLGDKIKSGLDFIARCQ